MRLVKKKGQFFLIAALIIITIILGFGMTYNKVSSTKQYSKVYDLSEEIKFEAIQIIDNGIYKELNQSDINKNINNLSLLYAKSNKDIEMLILYGNRSSINCTYYKNGLETSITLSTGCEYSNGSAKAYFENSSSYNFYTTNGQNFFVILKKEENNERFISAR